METGFALVALVTVILNLVLPEEIEDEETPELTADDADEVKDEEEWNRIRAAKMGGEDVPALKTV
jgi:hypothetical protein